MLICFVGDQGLPACLRQKREGKPVNVIQEEERPDFFVKVMALVPEKLQLITFQFQFLRGGIPAKPSDRLIPDFRFT